MLLGLLGETYDKKFTGSALPQIAKTTYCIDLFGKVCL